MSINPLLDKLFRRHNKELLYFAAQRAGGAAEDLVQEAYMRLLQHPDPASIDNPRAFLFRTTTNLTVDHHRRQMLEARYQPEVYSADADVEAEMVKMPGKEPPPEAQASQQQELDRLRTMLNELPELPRHAFMLNRIEGLSHKEIGKRLGISDRSSERYVGVALRHLLKHSTFDE
ncbi:RNA polymerase sigma factor [Methylomonas fluvii]|uniref:Sigma-70 family RNA polymerase sigma factor n=1 Tax=Methylomonas fluvii TaxID=1854564 RepID=A0ABR9DBS4_9GAMM|nr:sigma-70 family RNA polymerase sigma factor [Methylomonas fluvii]MBD9360559.1 sigma-70 family RNA polymerase sigma factor [Methylomonas fluvii]CAD6873390.1 RNA polymerase sigma factor RpoE [Methylomonas fluvii]